MSLKTCPFLDRTCAADNCMVWRKTSDGGECALLAAGNYAGSITVQSLELFKQMGGKVIKSAQGPKVEAHPEKIFPDWKGYEDE